MLLAPSHWAQAKLARSGRLFMSFAMHTHAQQGIISPVITLILALLAFFYLRGWFRIRRASPIVFPAWRLAAFMTGLFVIWVTVDSPLAALDHQLLTAHMLKHLLLMTVAAPLILFAAPSRQLLCGLPKRFMGLSSFLRSRTPPFLG